jgi:hypothetical protein
MLEHPVSQILKLRFSPIFAITKADTWTIYSIFQTYTSYKRCDRCGIVMKLNSILL